MMKLTVIVLVCLAASSLGMKKFIKNEETFGIKNLMFFKMLFGDKLGLELVKEMTVEEKLIFDLLKVYNRHVNPTDLTTLKFSLYYLCANVDKKTLMMTSRVIENYEWKDTRLIWDPVEYNNIKEISFPAKKIWTPDMKLFNSHIEAEMRDEVNVVIKHDGTVLWIPLVTYKTNCLTTKTVNTGVNIGMLHTDRIFNNDVFKCKLVIGSWTLDKTIMKLMTVGEGIIKDEYLDTCVKHDITEVKVMIKDHTYPLTSPNKIYPALHLDFLVREKGF